MSSSPQLPSSPVQESNDRTTAPDSSPSNNNPVPSSPLFLPSSSSSHQAGPSSDRSRNERSDLFTITDGLARRRVQSRGDVHGSDAFSSPMRRRYFTENNGVSSPIHNTQRQGEELSSTPNLSYSSSSGLPSSDAGILPSLSSSSSNTFQSNDQQSQILTSETETSDGPIRVIWGTHVSIEECSDNFRSFLMTFKMKYRKRLDGLGDTDPEDDKLYYVNMLNSIKETGSTNLNLDARNLLSFPATKNLHTLMINYPQEVIPIMDQTIKDCLISSVVDDPEYHEGVEDSSLAHQIESNIYKVRPFNINNGKGMRELNPQDIDKLVSIKGLIIRSTPIIPDMKTAFFRCNVCDHTVVIENDRGIIQEPTKCPRQICDSVSSMQLIHNRSTFANKQVVKLQETPDLIPDGQTPHSVSLCVYDELVDASRAGDRVEICGIFKSSPVRVNPRQRTLKSLFKTYLDVVYIKKIDKHRLGADPSTLENELRDQEEVDEIRKLSTDEIDKIKRVSKRDDLYELLARSLAPSIFEMDDVKKGLLLQLFGGTSKDFKKGSRTRGEINVLLCGDPSTSKSQILQYVHKIAPRGIYTSGKGSSAVGLTAYVTRDIDTKQLVLESGALVLSDGGICCIDEFDKMSDQTRSVLHEVMEQQTISIAKAGIITTLNARTSILASANPIQSRYNPDLPVTKNIDLPPPLLSRFDLVYLILDKVDEQTDSQLATHIASMYLEDNISSANKSEILPVEFLTGYIQYAKENCFPSLTEEAKDELVRSYVEMRKMGEDVRTSEKRITATTRQLESMIRLSEAHAKMHLRENVELEDVIEAVRLIKSAIKDYATDPLTGRIDMDLVQTGHTSTERKLKEDLSKVVIQLLEDNGELGYDQILDKVNNQSDFRVENADLGEVLRRLESEGKIIVFGQGHRRKISINRNVV